MKVLVDNDIVHKIAAFDLVEEFLAWAAEGGNEIQLLPTAKYKFKIKDRKGESRYGIQVFDRIAALISKVGEVTEGLSSDHDFLVEIQGIDSGEALLFSAVSSNASTVLLTGDKRSLRTLQTDQRCKDLSLLLKGRVICLEQIMEALISRIGFNIVRVRIAGQLGCDQAMRMIFSNGAQSDEQNAMQGLASYTASLRLDTGLLLAVKVGPKLVI